MTIYEAVQNQIATGEGKVIASFVSTDDRTAKEFVSEKEKTQPENSQFTFSVEAVAFQTRVLSSSASE